MSQGCEQVFFTVYPVKRVIKTMLDARQHLRTKSTTAINDVFKSSESVSIGQIVPANQNSMVAFLWAEDQPAEEPEIYMASMAPGVTFSELMVMDRERVLAALRTELELPVDTRSLIIKLERDVEGLEARMRKEREAMLQLQETEAMLQLQEREAMLQLQERDMGNDNKRMEAMEKAKRLRLDVRLQSAEAMEKWEDQQEEAIQEKLLRLNQQHQAIQECLRCQDRRYEAIQEQLQALRQQQ